MVSIHAEDRCTIGALKLYNVYIIHITPQKVLIKLYMANGGGSHRLKVLPISQMPQWIDGEHWWGVWFEDGFDLTPELFASVFSHPFPAPCLFSLGLVPCVFEYYKEVKDTRMYMHKKYLQIYVYSQLLNMNLFWMRIIRSTRYTCIYA